MTKLTFDPKLHAYRLGGKPITGCTTILNVIAKPFLIPWAANMAVDYIEAKEKEAEGLGLAKETLQEARKAHAQKRDKAGDIGKEVHRWAEQYIKSLMGNKNNAKVHTLLIDNQQLQKMSQNFINWAKENKVKFLASEKQVYSEKYFFCGTYDFLAEIDGKTYLGDIKTTSNIYPEHFIQCAGYQICEEELNPKLKIDGHIVVNLSKDGKIKTQTNYDVVGYKRLFLAALVLYRGLFQK